MEERPTRVEASGLGLECCRSIVEAAPLAMLVAGRDGRVLFLNAQAERLLGYGREELCGAEAGLFLPEGLRAGNGRQARRKDGTELPVEVTLSSMSWEGQPAVLASLVDQSPRRHDLARLRAALARLRHSYDDLERFAYAASHDLRGPGRMVINCCELLQRRYGRRLDAEADRMLSLALDEARRMESMAEGLLSYVRVRARPQVWGLVDAATAVSEAAAALGPQIQQTHAKLDAAGLPKIRAAQEDFVMLLRQLLDNAVKFRGQANPEIVIRARRVDGEWLFSVKDNGQGIDPKDRERVFGLFQRSRRGNYPGSGMGLPICRRIVERYGGRIWVESQPGRGATFYFTLPDKPVPDADELDR